MLYIHKEGGNMTVKVKNISGLEDYASSIQSFAGKFEIAASDTVRQFNTSLKGEKAEAINAFFKKLNAIQNTVFSEAPGAIRVFGQHISSFAEEIKGLGFSNKAFTEDDAMSKLVESLSTSQLKEITLVKDGLVSLFDEAVSAMGEGDSNIGNFDTEAGMYIASEISARTGTHTGINFADSTLSANVSGSANEFICLVDKTRNARVISSICPSKILGAIQRGDFTKDDVIYLNRLRTHEDAKILNSLFSDKIEDIDQIMENNPDKISTGGYQNLAEVLSKWMDRSENGKNKMNRLLSSMAKIKRSNVETFSKNLLNEHANLKDLYAANMRKYEKSDKFNQTEMHRRRMKLDQMNDLSGLLVAIRVLKVGEDQTREEFLGHGSDHMVRDSYIRRHLTINLNNAKDSEWKIALITEEKEVFINGNVPIRSYDEVDVVPKKNTNVYTSHFETDTIGGDGEQFKAELTEIDNEQKKVQQEFRNSLSRNGIKGILEYVGGPIASGTFSVLSSLTTGDKGDGVENTEKIIEEIAPGRYNSLLKYSGKPSVSSLKDYFKMDDKIKELKQKDKDVSKKIYNHILGQGGWSLNEDATGQTIMSSSEIYTDYSAYKRVDELNEKGVMGYFESRNLEKRAREEIDKSFSHDPKMRTFLLGLKDENKKIDGELLNVQTMTPEQIVKMDKLIEDVKGTNSAYDFNQYFVEKYGN